MSKPGEIAISVMQEAAKDVDGWCPHGGRARTWLTMNGYVEWKTSERFVMKQPFLTEKGWSFLKENGLL